MIPKLRTVGEKEMGSRVLLIARCEIVDDASDILGSRHQDIDSFEGLWFSMIRDDFDDWVGCTVVYERDVDGMGEGASVSTTAMR